MGSYRPHQLSGGQQQRVGLARALATDPDILLFDEPFSALDPLIRRDMQDEVVRLRREVNKTMVFITHDLSEALRLGDRIAIMRDGRFVQVGTPEAVVVEPADDYVGNFVRDVPRSFVVPVEHVIATSTATSSAGRSGSAPRSDDVVKLVAHSEHPVQVVDDAGKEVGCVDRVHVLALIAGSERQRKADPQQAEAVRPEGLLGANAWGAAARMASRRDCRRGTGVISRSRLEDWRPRNAKVSSG